jgi:quinoprotein glucose dehydrogenase
MNMRWLFLWCFAAVIAVATTAGAENIEAIEAAKKFELPAGFKAEVVAAEPLLANPVSFSINEKGEIYVAETYRLDNAVMDITKRPDWIKADLALRRVSDREKFLTNAFGTNQIFLTRNADLMVALLDTNRDGVIETRKIMTPGGLRQVSSGLAAGVLARGNKVWLACVPDLWRFDDPQATNHTAKRLSTGYGVHIGVTGHDLHGLTLGMDGKLYYSMGDRGFVVQTRIGTTMNYPDTGGILRCNQDGSELEVYAIGLRNPQELTFDELGNLWAADNDTAGADKSRLIHVVEGADYGWRTSYQHMKGFGPWVQENAWEGRIDGTLPTCGEPAQGPAGFAYYPGTGLPSGYEGCFLLCDFPGGIQTFRVEPKGASYVIKDKKRFLWNAWPTDVEFGFDGGLYFSDWVNGWTLPQKGRIYKITNPDVAKDPKTISTAKIFAEGLENKTVEELVALLEHHDLRVRQGAHLILGKKPQAKPALLALATDPAKSRAPRLHAIWALRMHGIIDSAHLEKLLADPDQEIRAQAMGGAPTATLVRMMKDESPRVRFYAAMALKSKILLDSNNTLAADAAIEFLERNGDADPYLTHAGVQLLIYSRPGLQRARKHAAVAVRRAALLADRAVGSSVIGTYLNDPVLVYEAARAINDVPVVAGASALAALLTNNCPENVMSRAINANYRIGGPPAAVRLATFAAKTDAPAASRVDALSCLGNWEEPSDLDRVMGLYRPIPANVRRRPDSVAIEALQPHWAALFADKEPAVAKAALQCVDDLNVREQETNVLAVFRSTARPKEVRAAALKVLGGFNETNFASVVEMALAEKDFKAEALGLVPTNATPAIVKTVLETISNEGDVPTLQAAFDAVNRLAPKEAEPVLKQALGRLDKKELPREVALDLLEAATNYPALKRDIGNDALLVGGNAEAGRRVFVEKTEVACQRCHALNGIGGTVGPALDGIGARQPREYLLDSILTPNKAIAKGYENVTVTFVDGSTLTGVVTEQTTLTIGLFTQEAGKLFLRRADLKGATSAPSSMPDGLADALTKTELRDLVEFLASLK